MDTKILVVEDEGVVAEDIRSKLADLGYNVPGIAFTAEEALAIAEQERPDLVLMDISLQGAVDGIAAANEITKRLSIPVVFLTAFSDSSTIETAKETQPYGFMLKPFTERELQVAVEMALHRQSVERGLLKSKRLFENALENVSDAIITTDERGIVNFMNHHAEALTGWTRGDAIGEELTNVFTVREEFDEKIRESVKNALQGRENRSMNGHAVLLDRKKTEKPVRDIISTLQDETGEINGVVVVFRDFEQVTAAAAAGASEQPAASAEKAELDLDLDLNLVGELAATPTPSEGGGTPASSDSERITIFARAVARYVRGAMSVVAGHAALGDLEADDRRRVRQRLRDIESTADDARDLAQRILDIVGAERGKASLAEVIEALRG